MRKLLLLSFLLFLAASCNQKTPAPAPAASPPPPPTYNYSSQLKVGNQVVSVEVADTEAAREQGLSFRSSMADNQGMLFIFDAATTPAFWMKEMRFNLDFIWIDDGKIIGVTPNVPAPDPKCEQSKVTCPLPLYYPPSPVTQVLEVNSGWAKKNNIAVGDVVVLRN